MIKKNNNVETIDAPKKKKAGGRKVFKTAALATTLGLMASAIVGLSVSLYFSLKTVKTHESYQRQMDAVYFRAYYDLLDGADDMGISLKKLGASSSPTMQQSLLYEVWSAASLAESSLGMFEADSIGLLKAEKFVNQLGDYCHTLAIRVSNGEPLTLEERNKLLKLGEVASALERALEKLKDEVDGGKAFVGSDAVVSLPDAFSEFAEPSFEYPEMIYDGPFSDALETKAPFELTGEDITVDEGMQLIKKYFDDRRLDNIKAVDEGRSKIYTVNYTLTVDGNPAFVQLSKKGGMLASFNMARLDENAVVQEANKTCQQMAIAFAKKVGYGELEVVWSSSAHGECVVNLAPVSDEVVLYPDLIKVKIDENSLKVTGFDATHYLFNHRARKLPKPAITLEEAEASLSIPAIGEGRLALIPLRGEKETLTYEFECEKEGTYFVYIDAQTGDEANILFVIDDEGGEKTA